MHQPCAGARRFIFSFNDRCREPCPPEAPLINLTFNIDHLTSNASQKVFHLTPAAGFQPGQGRRGPEVLGVPGFRLPPDDRKERFRAFYEAINIEQWE